MTTTIVHARIHTVQPGQQPADSIAWCGDRIVAVGTREAVRAAATGPRVEVDLGSRSVVPGFIDAHHHAGIAALYGGRLRLGLPDVTDIASLQSALAAAAATTPPGRWIVGVEWNELLLRERRAPTRAELDDAVPDHPLLALHYSCHRAAANSRALALAGIDRHTPTSAGGSIERGAGHEPNGLLIERAMHRVEALARADLLAHDAEEIIRRLGEHDRAALATGITRLADAAVPTDLFAIYEAAHARGLARIPTLMMPVSIRGWLESPTDVLEAEPYRPRAATLTVGPVKLVFDGAPECAMCLGVWQSAVVFLRTAAISLREGTLDPLRTAMSLQPRYSRDGVRTGILMYDASDAASVVRRAVERGMAVATHAEGNEAVDVVLDAYEAAGARLHAPGRARLEHGMFLDPHDVERLAALGVAVVAQPPFLQLPELRHTPRIPGIAIKPFRSLLEAGVMLVGSSDFPVTTFDPLVGLRAAVHRPHLDPEQALDIEEALALYTRSAAAVLGLEREIGTLEAGKRADLVVLDRALDERSVHEARVATTVLGGELVHGTLS